MFGLDLFEMIGGGAAILGYTILCVALREYYKRIRELHRKWKKAVEVREEIEQELGTEIVGLRASVMALEGIYDEEELEVKREQAKIQATEDWRIRQGRPAPYDLSLEGVKARFYQKHGYNMPDPNPDEYR